MQLILLSGGVDSALLLWRRPKARALFVDYGQPSAAQELAAARRLCALANDSGRDIGQLVTASVTLLGLDDMSAPTGQSGARVVYGRNLALIAIGANVARALGCDAVAIGAHQGDARDYADCRPGFIFRADRAASYGCEVGVQAPLISLSKREILREAGRLGVPLGECWSCYTPRDGRPCETCNSCKERAGL